MLLILYKNNLQYKTQILQNLTEYGEVGIKNVENEITFKKYFITIISKYKKKLLTNSMK